ncbi:hypothetical protein Dsin_017447 [Dipteronia sinensis]|uniref:Reverse transcriptase domain-containing protein n=1 Tax=Dipteronia sinensis TaxID=43782 RepID=A0AAE0AEY5_9ROSI|nr:hypothetical protein Dsin_017447 [Dipteronia sinensis]
MAGSFSSSWLVVGDLNAVLGAHECLGCRSPARGSCEDFKSMIEDCNLIGVRSQGACFTWVMGRSSRNRVERRLDMTLVSEGCTTCWRDISCVALPYRFSNHCPLWIRLAESQSIPCHGRPPHVVIDLIDQDLSIVDDIVPSLVSHEENSLLVAIPSADVIHDAVFAMDALSAPRPDGFSCRFFQRCWEIVGRDVILAVQDFFHSGVVTPGLNSNFIVLLPKMRDSITIDQFRPIVLGNFRFKVSSKILADRDRHVEDCTALASDCVNVVYKKCYGGNVAMTIDIRKAFDTLDWKFLCQVLMAFGFSQTFMDWIVSIMGSSKLSILINGSPPGYFGCSRGVRPGDPLSPLFFGIAEDFLSRLLSRMVASDQLFPISYPIGFSAPTHLLYADDVLIFCRGTVKNLRRVVHAFRVYGSISGQLVNWSKSSIIFGSSVSPARISSLQSLVGMQIGQLPFSYLGVPLFRGKPRKSILMPIADKILSKFSKWKGKSLSLADWATLIRSVITGSFVHYFIVHKRLIFLIQMVTKKIRNFLWTGSCEETKLVRVAWNRCCRPYAFGGLGLKDLALLNDYLLQKLTWKFITSIYFAFTFLHERMVDGFWMIAFELGFKISTFGLVGLRFLRSPGGGTSGLAISPPLVQFRLGDICLVGSPLKIVCAALWEAIFSAFQRRVSADTWGSFFRQAMYVSFSDQIRVLWRTVIHAVVWSVWYSRYQWIFEEKSIDFRAALSLVWRSVYDANHLGIGCMRKMVVYHCFYFGERV